MGVLLGKEPKGGCSFLLTAEEKESKKTVTPKAPYIGGCNRSSCRSYIKVSSDHQRSGLIIYHPCIGRPLVRDSNLDPSQGRDFFYWLSHWKVNL